LPNAQRASTSASRSNSADRSARLLGTGGESRGGRQASPLTHTAHLSDPSASTRSMKRRLSLASVPSRRPPAPAAAEASERNDVPGIASASPTNSTARVRRFLLPRRKGHEPPPIAKRKKEPRPGGGSRLFLFLTSEAIEKDSAQRVRHGPGEVLTTQGPREALTPACGSRGPRETLTSGLGYRLRHTIPNPSFGGFTPR
jgi:hypothetical protein